MELREAKARIDAEHPDWDTKQKIAAIKAIRDEPGDPNWVKPGRARPLRAAREAIVTGVKRGMDNARQS